MKTMKKLFALLLAVLMVMGMATTAMAETITITINNDAAQHRYEAYQVFSGTLSSSGVLSDVEWGTGVNGDDLLTALKASGLFLKDGVNAFAGCADAEDVANIISKWNKDETPIKNFADIVSSNLATISGQSNGKSNDDKYVITVTGPGYYFIKDADAVTGNNVISDHMLYVVKSLEIFPKDSEHTFSKTVNNTLEGTYVNGMDAQIGDTVYFKLETKLPSRFHDYKQYRMYMEDVLPAGLEFNRLEEIYVAHASGGHTYYYNAEASNPADNAYSQDDSTTSELSYARKFGFAGNKLIVNFGDLKITQTNPNLNDTITVKYSAILKENPGTPETDVVFGKGADGKGNQNAATVYFSNNMNENSATSFGSITDTASVYTYQLEVTKQDSQTQAPLADAEFYLYRKVTNADNSESTMYAVLDANKVISNWTIVKGDATVLTSGADGKFVVKGLDSLIYHLEEKTAPEGYNKMEETVKVTISGTIDGDELTALTGSADSNVGTGTVNEGKLAVTVDNNPGTMLPTTGGIGTTIFYIVGGVLVLGAGAAFVMKRRNEA